MTSLEATPNVLAEASLRCADLANLASCTVPALPPGEAPRAIEAARLAAGAAFDLRSAVESQGGDPGDEHAKNLLRDAQSAAWRAGFAMRQVG